MHTTTQPLYQVETSTLCDGWVNCWQDAAGLPLVFTSEKQAQQELSEFLSELAEEGIEHSPDDFRISTCHH